MKRFTITLAEYLEKEHSETVRMGRDAKRGKTKKWKCRNSECPLMRKMSKKEKAYIDKLTGWDGEREPTKAELNRMEIELNGGQYEHARD